MYYRRAFTPGGSFFFSVITDRRQPILANADAIGVLKEAFRTVKSQRPFDLDAIVVLPDHLHCIWTLPTNDADFATRWRLIKTWFTKHCDPGLRVPPNRARSAKQEQSVWQHRYWEHLIRDEADYSRHVDYIHYNPVKHGHVDRPSAWPYSSFRKFVRPECMRRIGEALRRCSKMRGMNDSPSPRHLGFRRSG